MIFNFTDLLDMLSLIRGMIYTESIVVSANNILGMGVIHYSKFHHLGFFLLMFVCCLFMWVLWMKGIV